LAKGAIANIDFNYDAAFYFGRHETDLHPYYKQLLKKGMRCFDIGAYRGWDALTLAYLTGSEVVSFELVPRFIEMAKDFLEPSNLNIRLVEACMSDGTGGTATVDQAASEYFLPDFIKIDVEGAEASVLRGASKTLMHRHPALVVEVHGKTVEADCVSLLKSFGYSSVTVDRSFKLLSEARGFGHNRWLVCVGDQSEFG